MCDSTDSDFNRPIIGSRLLAADSMSSVIRERFFDLSIDEVDSSIILLARLKSVDSALLPFNLNYVVYSCSQAFRFCRIVLV